MKIWTKIAMIALVGLMAGGCSKDDNGNNGNGGGGGGEKPIPEDLSGLAGEWVLSSWAEGSELAGKSYLALDVKGVFTLYQNFNEAGFAARTGTFSFDAESKILSGVYSDKEPWKNKYLVSKLSAQSMTLVETTNQAAVSVYTRTVIPDFVKMTKAMVASQGVDWLL